MLKEAPGPINFTVFLTMFGEKLKGEELFCTLTTTNIQGHGYFLEKDV